MRDTAGKRGLVAGCGARAHHRRRGGGPPGAEGPEQVSAKPGRRERVSEPFG